MIYGYLYITDKNTMASYYQHHVELMMILCDLFELNKQLICICLHLYVSINTILYQHISNNKEQIFILHKKNKLFIFQYILTLTFNKKVNYDEFKYY